MRYEPGAFEEKWMKLWQETGCFHASDDADDERERFYALVEFPYPSGVGLHVGHPRPYTGMDVVARARRMQGQNVLFPFGWDAFGLPAENHAIKTGTHPRDVVRQNVERFKQQTLRLGFSFDYSREVNTTDPGYYKWTQWIFLKMLEKGLAYKSDMPVNWCPSCRCVLANEEVVGGVCERCESPTERRVKSQWMLAITKYAQRLLDDLDTVDYPERVKAQQRYWIGRSEGAEILFSVKTERALENAPEPLKVYTTRPDTLFGATYMVISPEHPALEAWKPAIDNWDELDAYRRVSAAKSDFERTEMQKDKTGVCIRGVTAVNPGTGKSIPVFISDYVLMSYGTGGIMAVPAHDTRDYDFAKTFDLPIVEVVQGGDVSREAYTDTEEGVLVNSGFLDGLTVPEAKEKMGDWLVFKRLGHKKVQFRLRDWVFARQRYWGEPIPVVHCPVCGIVPLPLSALPLTLPEVENYQPTQTGESPLAVMEDWVNCSCPKCRAPSKRETDTMPQWAGSSWYYLRYADAHNGEALASKEALERWTPVDWYNGGMEHTTLHLLYSRFWHKFLHDIGVAPGAEPYVKRTSHGFILGSDGTKISKSKGNGIDPMEVTKEHGADTMRLAILFIGDFEKGCRWNSETIKGCRRFLERLWSLADAPRKGEADAGKLHRTIQKVGGDIEQLKFNTAVAALMALLTELEKGCSTEDLQVFLRLCSPFAPFIAEELWARLFPGKGLCCQAEWPVFDPAKTVEDTMEMAVQVMGKLRDTLSAPRGAEEDAVRALALALPKIQTIAEGREPRRVIVVQDKLVNLIF